MPLFRRKNRHGFGGGFSPGRVLTAPFRAVLSLLSGPDNELGQHVPLPKQIFRFVLRIIFFPVWLVGQLILFLLMSWSSTRNGSAAMWSLIPFSLMLVVAGVVFGSNFIEDRLTKSMHRLAVIESEAVEDFDSALLFSKRVQNITQSPNFRFAHAQTLINAGLREQGSILIEELADPDLPGYVWAHQFLAEDLMRTPEHDPAYAENLELARKHLEIVRKKGNEGGNVVGASVLLGDLLFRQGDLERVRLGDTEADDPYITEAVEIYKQISDYAPQAAPNLIRYYMKKDLPAMANGIRTTAVVQLIKIAQLNPNNPRVWNLMYQILTVRESDYADAIIELDKGLRSATNDQARQAIFMLRSNVSLLMARSRPEVKNRDDFMAKVGFLSEAWQANVQNGEALKDLIDLLVYPASPEYWVWLKAESGKTDALSGPLVYMFSGVRDSIQGKAPSAEQNFQLAFRDRRIVSSINQIALILAVDQGKPADALRLIDTAIDTWRTPAVLFQTRGQILLKLARYQEALPQLEYAAEIFAKDPAPFFLLAECYSKLGRSDEAVEMQEKAVVLQKKIEALQREAIEQLSGGTAS